MNNTPHFDSWLDRNDPDRERKASSDPTQLRPMDVALLDAFCAGRDAQTEQLEKSAAYWYQECSAAQVKQQVLEHQCEAFLKRVHRWMWTSAVLAGVLLVSVILWKVL